MTLPAASARTAVPGNLPESVLALDLGGTRTRSALVKSDGTLIGRVERRTPHATAREVVAACVGALEATLAEVRSTGDQTNPVALGISAPGPLDPERGVLLDPPNLDRTLWNFPLAAEIGRAIGAPAFLERDTQVAILAEGTLGAAVGLTDYVYLTVSTGIGGAVVSGSRLLRGADGLAGELGHLTIDINGPVCGCGARGHLEGIASGTGIARAAHEAGLSRPDGTEIEARDVADLEDSGDMAAAAIMQRARDAFAAAAVSIVDVFNPRLIIVGGGIAYGQGDRLLDPARKAVRALSFRRQAARVQIVAAQLGEDVGLIGALPLVALAIVDDHGTLQEEAMAVGHVALSVMPPLDEDGGDKKDQQAAATR